MLSKSAARRFFLVGTFAASLAFVLLTVDTIKQVPKQTNAENLTAEVIRGKHLFESKNCMGCHTIMGEGAYYAPELTKVHERRGEVFIKSILKDPESMYPGQRRMVNYKLTPQEIDDLTAFLKWVGEMNLNGFPPKPDLVGGGATAAAAGAQVSVADLANKPVVFTQVCVACHSLGGAGGAVGPTLDDVGQRRSPEYLKAWLENPAAVKPDSKMPKLPLTDDQIVELVKFLSGLKAGASK